MYKTDVLKALSCDTVSECLKALVLESKVICKDKLKAFEVIDNATHNAVFNSFVDHVSLLLAFKHARVNVLNNVRADVLRRAESETNINKLIALNAQHIRISEHINKTLEQSHRLIMNQ